MPNKTAGELAAEAKAKVENLSVDQFAKEVGMGNAVVIDLREPEELANSGRMSGSVHVPRGMLEFRADPTSPYHNSALDHGARTLLYCANGDRSALGAAALQELGYTNMAYLEGGFEAWSDAGKPVERD